MTLGALAIVLLWGAVASPAYASNPDPSYWAWGANSVGQIGDGTFVNRSSPVEVAATSFTSVATGQISACGLTAAGVAYCWGDDSYGQLGNGSTGSTSQPEPVSMPVGISFTQITVGISHACGLSSDGSAYCWGGNAYGQIGDGTTATAYTPQLITGYTFVSLTAGGQHTCGLTSGGAGYCWGENVFGQLGIGNTILQTAPHAVTMPSATSFASMTAGSLATCALSTSGSAYCWGGNSSGQLGDGTVTSRSLPGSVLLPAGTVLSQLVSGGNHTCGIATSGEMVCWGYNSYGQVGVGNTTSPASPQVVPESTQEQFRSIAAGLRSTCALTDEGEAWCWGSNGYGQLGIGSLVNSSSPQRVVVNGSISSLALGSTAFAVYALPLRRATGDQVPTAPLQQFARAESDTCEKQPTDLIDFPALAAVVDHAWGMSWAQWPNGGTGGFVCTRQPYYTSSDTWNVE